MNLMNSWVFPMATKGSPSKGNSTVVLINYKNLRHYFSKMLLVNMSAVNKVKTKHYCSKCENSICMEYAIFMCEECTDLKV